MSWEGVRFRVQDFLLESGARLWVGSTGPDDADQLGFVCLFCIYLRLSFRVLPFLLLDFMIKKPYETRYLKNKTEFSLNAPYIWIG